MAFTTNLNKSFRLSTFNFLSFSNHFNLVPSLASLTQICIICCGTGSHRQLLQLFSVAPSFGQILKLPLETSHNEFKVVYKVFAESKDT